MKKYYIILIVMGLILIILPYCINFFSIFRLISLLIGIVVLFVGLIIYKPKKTLRVVVYPIVIFGLILVWDFIVASALKGIPVIAFFHESSPKVRTYNSLFYRVYDCDNIKTFDGNYMKKFICNPESIDITPINKFLENPKESYKDSKGKFVRLKGKINTIVGNSSLTLNAYDEKIELNGDVVFDEEKKVVINNLDINPADYHIYDVIEVIGLVDSFKESDDQTIIYLNDAVIIKSDLYTKYELLVNNINSREKIKKDEKLYYLGIQGIFYKYDENNIYEIDYLLLDKRENLENLIGDISPSELDEVHKLYELENYNIVVCENEDIIFANKDITKLQNVCETNEN